MGLRRARWRSGAQMQIAPRSGCRRGSAARAATEPGTSARRGRSSRGAFPGFQVGQRVDRMAAERTASRRPRSRSAGAAWSRRRSARHGTAAAPRRRPGRRLTASDSAWQWANMKSKPTRVLDGVVAGAARLVAGRRDRAGERRDDRRAFGGEHVLALVDVVAARRPEAVFRTPEVVRAGDREDGASAADCAGVGTPASGAGGVGAGGGGAGAPGRRGRHGERRDARAVRRAHAAVPE